MAEEKQEHDLHQLWQRVNSQSSDLGEIARNQTSTDQKLDGFIVRVEDSMRNITNGLKAISDRVYQPAPAPNYVGVASVFITALTTMVGFVYLTVAPLDERDKELAIALTRSIENSENRFVLLAQELNIRQKSIGGILAKQEWNQTWLGTIEEQLNLERARNADLEERVSRTEGRVELLIDRVKDIDSAGSRRWNRNRIED